MLVTAYHRCLLYNKEMFQCFLLDKKLPRLNLLLFHSATAKTPYVCVLQEKT